MDYLKLNDTVHFRVTLHNISGVRKHADESPFFYVFEQASDTPIISRSGMGIVEPPFTGVYRGTFAVNAANGFDLGNYYTVMVSGKVNDLVAFHVPFEFNVVDRNLTDLPTVTGVTFQVWEEKLTLHTNTNTFGSGVNLADSHWAYYADIKFTKDTSNDEYTVDWFRNAVPLASSVISNGQLQVIKRADGTNLIPATTMDYVSIAVGTLKLNEGTNRMTDGEAAIAKATATIDGSTRTWLKLIGRDS
jgi:hypothetical protein